jgi:probable F420-dependent oxidoreductase
VAPSRVGIVLGSFASLPPRAFVETAREAEARGYHTGWIGEAAGVDALTTSAVVLSHTEHLHVATGVIPVQVRTPVTFGLTLATLDHLAPGRFALGLGLSSPVIVGQWHGLRFSRAVDQLREAVGIIRATASGERVNFEGTHYRVKNFRFFGPVPVTPPRIVLAALGPRMLELAGEIADGVLLNWIPPEAIPGAIAHVEAGAKRAGRSLDDFEIAAFVRVCVTTDVAPARDHLARDITVYGTVNVYRDFFRSAGYGAEIDALDAAWKAGDRAGAVKQLTPRVLDGLGVVGDEAFCRARLADFTRAGLTMPVIAPFTHEKDAAPALLRTLRAFP